MNKDLQYAIVLVETLAIAVTGGLETTLNLATPNNYNTNPNKAYNYNHPAYAKVNNFNASSSMNKNIEKSHPTKVAFEKRNSYERQQKENTHLIRVILVS